MMMEADDFEKNNLQYWPTPTPIPQPLNVFETEMEVFALMNTSNRAAQ